MIRTFRSRLVAVSTGVLLAAATLGSLAPTAQAETAAGQIPATITASPTTGLVSGSTVTVSATADNNWNIYSLRARLCKGDATINNAGDFSPTLGGNCIPTPLANNTDSDVIVTTSPGARGSASLDFKVGAGSQTFTTQYDGSKTIACGVTSATGCKLVVEMSAAYLNGRVIYQSFPLTYASPNAPTGVSAVRGGSTTATVSWSASASQQGLPTVSSYTVTSVPGGLTCSSASTSCDVTGLSAGTSYTFDVTATNALGTSAATRSTNSLTLNSNHSISSTPNSGLASGDVVTQSVSMSAGNNLYSARTRLCKASASVINAGDFSPTLGGNCIASPLAYGTDSDVTVTTNAGDRSSATLNFTVGAGSITFTTQYDGAKTITCGTPTTKDACALVTELSYTGSLGGARLDYVVTPVIFLGAPAAPTSLIATPGNASASIAFTAGDFGSSAITKYQYSINSGANWTDINDVTSPVSITGLTNGTSYNIVLRAVNAIGNGAASSGVSVTPRTTPAAPTSLNATPGNGSASISFTAGSTGGSAITKYQFSIDSGANWTDINDVTSPVSITGLTNGTSYDIVLRAVNAAGPGTASSAVTVKPRTTPAAPTALGATPGNGSASISFTPGSTGGAAIMNYQYSLDGGSTWLDFAEMVMSSPATISGLSNGTTYNVRLRAVNVAGPGTASSAVTVMPAATKPGAPAAPGVVVTAAGAVTVTWVAPDNGGSAITGYTVTATGGASPIVKTITNPSSVSQVFTGLSTSVTYTFTVRATNAVNTGDPSPGTATKPITTPSKPATILLGSTGNGSITVTFTAPSTDGGSAVTGYTVQAWAPSAVTPTSSCESNAATLTCTVTGLTNGVKYGVRVYAKNVVGTSTSYSSLRNIIPATTPGKPTITTVVGGDQQVTVTWTAPLSNGGSAITGYTVQAYNAAGTAEISGKSCTPATATGTSCVVSGLNNGIAYTFKVTAANAKGSGAASELSAAATPATVPGAPTNVQAVANTGKSVTISWSAPSTNGGSAITGYTVQAYTWNGSVATIVSTKKCTTTGSGTTCTITALTAGTQYKFNVTATNAKGIGAAATTTAVTAKA